MIDETLSPTWDEMLVMDDILVYGTKEEIKEQPPMVVIEIFDQDNVVSEKGHCLEVVVTYLKNGTLGFEPPLPDSFTSHRRASLSSSAEHWHALILSYVRTLMSARTWNGMICSGVRTMPGSCWPPLSSYRCVEVIRVCVCVSLRDLW